MPLALAVLLLLPVLATAQAPVVDTSSRRGEICLNGLWRFQPALGPAAAAPGEEWGQIPVPGSWAGTASVPGPRATGQSGPWAAAPLAQVGRCWYEQTVVVPESWRGRAVSLEVGRVSTDAVVALNGVECGRIDWPHGEVDLTSAVRFGGENTLRLLVAAVPEAKDVVVYMGVGNDQTWTQPARLATRGLIGEVFLRSRPAGAYVSDVFVRPSVRRREVALDVEIRGVTQPGEVAFTARMLDEQGRQEQTFSARQALRAVAVQTVTLTWPWPNPRLWDLGQPRRYTLQLAVRGAGLEDEWPQPFGFREFWIEGTRFLLNGVEIRLRPVCLRDEWNNAAWVPEAIANMLRAYAAVGFNLGEHWPTNEDERGAAYLRDLWAEEADRQGFLLAGNALSMNGAIMDPSWRPIWDQPQGKQRWEPRMAAQLRRLRNHPSIVMWGTSANFFGRQQDQAPRVIGRRDWYPKDAKATAGLDGVATIKRHDPTRPVFTHHGADIGDLHTCNNYLCLIPLQEREEWLSEYVAKADLPYLPIEFGTPLHTTFMRGRNGFGETVVSEPLMTEFCAVYLGSEAYRLETDAYRQRLERTYQGPQRWGNWHNAPELEQAPAFQELQALFIRNTWRSWRTWGLTAGMVPWSMGHGWAARPKEGGVPAKLDQSPGRRGVAYQTISERDLHYLQPEGGWVTYPAGQALLDTNGPTLAWLAGPARSFTSKDHGFNGGETVAKQVVLCCDQRTAQRYRVTWTARLGDRVLATDEREGEVRPAQNLFLPVSFQAPAVTADTAGRIELTATIGDRQHRDVFDFRVLAGEPAAATPGPVHLFDPEGATTALLRSVGVTGQVWDGRARPGELVVVGRHALDGGVKPPGALEEHVAAGGRLLLFAQSPEWLRQAMQWRVARHVSRRFFPVPSQQRHPLLAGIDAEALRDWRGAGSLVPTEWGGLDESPTADPVFGWHWGNTGSVSSGAIEKPHHSGWTPLLEGEFDLAYTPLMELDHGRGHAVWCTLDLEGRTAVDPVAQRLARRLVAYAAAATPAPRAATTVYLGGAPGLRLLRQTGLRCEPAERLPAGRALAVIGSDAAIPAAELEPYLRGGGRALLLPRGAGADPWQSVAAPAPFHGASTVPDWPECRGLSLSDLRLRGTVPLAPVTARAPVSTGADGLLGRVAVGDGVAVLLQLTADQLPAGEKTYLRYSQWRLTRTLCQLLANLGGSFEMDGRSLTPGWNLGNVPLSLAGEWQFRIERKLPAAASPTARTEDPGLAAEAADWPTAPLSAPGWTTVTLPGSWESWPGVGEADGSFWVRRAVDLPADWASKELVLQLGAVDDRDVTWLNGQRLGETSGWNVPRTYRIPAGSAKAGRNVLTIRVFDEFGGGGFSARADELRIGPAAAPPVIEGTELLRNTDFAADLKDWTVGSIAPAEAKATVTAETPPALLGQRAVRFEVTKPSTTSWHASFSQPGFGIRAGVTYVWSLWLRASQPATVTAAIEKNHPPFGGAGLFQRTPVGTDWKRLTIRFTPRESDDNVRFSLQELAAVPVTFWFAAPSFSVAPEPGSVSDRAPVGFYRADWLDSHALGDDPYRYYRW